MPGPKGSKRIEEDPRGSKRIEEDPKAEMWRR